MRVKLIFLTIFIITGCTKFTENLNGDFIDYKEAKVSDFNTEFPVINIEVNQDEFDKMYTNFNEDIEIEGNLNVYRKNEQIIFNELVEIEIKGSFSASLDLKSLGIKFDKTFKEEGVLLNPEKVLPNHSLKEIKAFRLRNSGNDFTKTLLKDISYTQLAINAGLNLDLTYFEPSIVFVNSKFLGIMNLRSEANTNGISRLRDAKKKDITLAKINNPAELEKKDGDFDRIDAFIVAIEEQNLEYLKAEIDIDNFIDYIIFQSYIANVDWPYNNVRFYAVKDGPFRFVVYDLDWVNLRETDHHPLEFIRKPTRLSSNKVIKNPITDLFNVLYSDENFKTKFNQRYLEIINTKLLYFEEFNRIVDVNFSTIEQYMPTHLQKYTDIKTMIDWYRNIELLKANFRKREKHIFSMDKNF
ncbi:CotH kinase family protein [Aureibaculum conchae]|uniref:CotH kinase family protein n=1 Tax=Aureibaculum sp. 2308TA14-22 TaxID=3108392 RepID=UPI00339407CB